MAMVGNGKREKETQSLKVGNEEYNKLS